jgi:hypothetical protein
MKTQFRWLLVLAALVWLIGCTQAASEPSVVILSPPSGSQFYEGEDVAIQSAATDAQGVVRVELVVDGNVVRVDPSPTAQGQPNFTLIQTWRATAGTHTIVVRAYNAAGVMSDPVGVTLNILPRVAQASTPTTVTPVIVTATAPAPGALTATAPPKPPVAPTPTTAPPPSAPTATTAPPPPPPSPTFTLPPPPPPASCSGTPNISSFTASASGVSPASSITVMSGSTVTLSWGAVTNAESAEIDQGIGGVPTPGTHTFTATSTKTYTLTARCGSNTATRQVTVTVLTTIPPLTLVPPLTLIVIPTPATPAQVSPANGWVFRNYPRTATFTWGTVSGTNITYNIEIEKDTGTWTDHVVQTGLTGTSYTMPAFPGDNPGRWRVWATSGSLSGNKSDWRTFSFNTGASQYAGTWLNDDPGTAGVTKIIITHLGGQNLGVHPYGKCFPSDCDWGTKNVTFNGEPLVASDFPGAPGRTLTITLQNPAGTSLKAVYTYTGNTYTYYFHK